MSNEGKTEITITHHCTTVESVRLRLLKKKELHATEGSDPILQQLMVCVECGKSYWRDVEIVDEELEEQRRKTEQNRESSKLDFKKAQAIANGLKVDLTEDE